MGIEQSVLGKAVLVFGSLAFVYYSIWVLSAVRFVWTCPLLSLAPLK